MDGISIKSNFMRKQISRLVSAKLSEALGFEVDVNFENLIATYDEEDLKAKATLEIKMNKKEVGKMFEKLV